MVCVGESGNSLGDTTPLVRRLIKIEHRLINITFDATACSTLAPKVPEIADNGATIVVYGMLLEAA